jgi:mutator protein MutT
MRGRPEVCVGAVVVDGGDLLLIRRGQGSGVGLWSVPGGRVEPGETLQAAVVRELLEETGLTGRCGALMGVAERIGPEAHYVILDFTVSVATRRGAIAGDDADDVAWVGLERLDEMETRGELVPGLLAFLRAHGAL